MARPGTNTDVAVTVFREFAEDLFVYMAKQYKFLQQDICLLRKDDHKSEFSQAIGKSVLLLSHSYRPCFVKQFHRVFLLLLESEENTFFYASIFFHRIFERASVYKYLVLCAFLSELVLYHLFNQEVNNPLEYYISVTVGIFDDIHRMFFTAPNNGKIPWAAVREFAVGIAEDYDDLIPILEDIGAETEPFYERFNVLRSSLAVQNVDLSDEMETEPLMSDKSTETELLHAPGCEICKSDNVSTCTETENPSATKVTSFEVRDQKPPETLSFKNSYTSYVPLMTDQEDEQFSSPTVNNGLEFCASTENVCSAKQKESSSYRPDLLETGDSVSKDQIAASLDSTESHCDITDNLVQQIQAMDKAVITHLLQQEQEEYNNLSEAFKLLDIEEEQNLKSRADS